MELLAYPSVNYSKLYVGPTEGGASLDEHDFLASRNDWLKSGLKKTVHLLLVSHDNGVPSVLLLRPAHQHRWGLISGVVQPGASDVEGVNAVLKRIILKAEHGDTCQWTIPGDSLAQYWRPEFDEHTFPYLPTHVSRPKELLKIIPVILPPRCVIRVSQTTALDFVPLFEIVRGGHQYFDPMISAIPALLSKVNIKAVVPSGR